MPKGSGRARNHHALLHRATAGFQPGTRRGKATQANGPAREEGGGGRASTRLGPKGLERGPLTREWGLTGEAKWAVTQRAAQSRWETGGSSDWLSYTKAMRG